MKPSILRPTNRGSYNPFVRNSHDVKQDQGLLEFQDAIVVNVITNDVHPEYASDGYNIGAVQFRSITSDAFRPQANLNWALPADTNITDYPLLDEIVQVFTSLNRWYYHRRINVSAKVTSHSLPNLHKELLPIESSTAQDSKRKTALAGTPETKLPTNSNTKLGDNFTEPPNLFRLRHDEGDILLEGRSGHSIRFGAAWKKNTLFQSTTADQSPNILIRVGQDPNAKPSVTTQYGLVTEDINNDLSSMYMVTDQLISLTYSTAGSSVHQASILNFPRRLDGNQIVINTDRFVINTKKGKILGFALDGVHWTSSKDFTVDAEQNVVLNSKGRNSLISPKNYLGSKNSEDQPIPCGAELAKFLGDFIDAFLNNQATSPGADSKGDVIPPLPFSPGVISALSKLKSDVSKQVHASFNSTNSYTVK